MPARVAIGESPSDGGTEPLLLAFVASNLVVSSRDRRDGDSASMADGLSNAGGRQQ